MNVKEKENVREIDKEIEKGIEKEIAIIESIKNQVCHPANFLLEIEEEEMIVEVDQEVNQRVQAE